MCFVVMVVVWAADGFCMGVVAVAGVGVVKAQRRLRPWVKNRGLWVSIPRLF